MIDLRERSILNPNTELVVNRASTLRKLDVGLPTTGLDAYPTIPLVETGTDIVKVKDKAGLTHEFAVVNKATVPDFDPTTERIMAEEWPKAEALIKTLSSLSVAEQQAELSRYSETNPIWWFMREHATSAWVIDLAVSKGANFLDPLNYDVFYCPERVIPSGSFWGFNNQEDLKILNMLKLRKGVAQRNELMSQQIVAILENKMEAVLDGKADSILGGDLAAGKSIYFMQAMDRIFGAQPELRQVFGDGEGKFPFKHIAADRDPKAALVSKRWADRMGIDDILTPMEKYLVTAQSVFKGSIKRPDYIISSGLCDYFKSREEGQASKKGRFYDSMRRALAIGGDYVNFNILADPRIIAESHGLEPIFNWAPMYTMTIEELIRDHINEGGFSADEIQRVEVLDGGIGMVVAKKLRE